MLPFLALLACHHQPAPPPAPPPRQAPVRPVPPPSSHAPFAPPPSLSLPGPGNVDAGQLQWLELGPELTGAEPWLGPALAPVTLVVLSELQCPFCWKGHEMASQLVEGRGDTRLVRLGYPLNAECNARLSTNMHGWACSAEYMAACTWQQGQLWNFMAALEPQRSRVQGMADLLDVASGAGIDNPALRACLDSSATRARVEDEIRRSGTMEPTGVPTFFVGYQDAWYRIVGGWNEIPTMLDALVGPVP